METREQLVEVVQAGCRAGDRVAAREVLLDALDRLLHQLADLDVGVADPPVGDLEHLRLGLVDGRRDALGSAVADLGDVAGDHDQPAQHRGVLHDLGVVRRVDDRRGQVLQRVQRLDAADGVEQPSAPQLVGDGDRVDRSAGGEHADRGVEDLLMGRLVEVVVAQALLDDRAQRIA